MVVLFSSGSLRPHTKNTPATNNRRDKPWKILHNNHDTLLRPHKDLPSGRGRGRVDYNVVFFLWFFGCCGKGGVFLGVSPFGRREKEGTIRSDRWGRAWLRDTMRPRDEAPSAPRTSSREVSFDWLFVCGSRAESRPFILGASLFVLSPHAPSLSSLRWGGLAGWLRGGDSPRKGKVEHREKEPTIASGPTVVSTRGPVRHTRVGCPLGKGPQVERR